MKEVLEEKYTQIFSIFIELIVKLSLIYYQNDSLKKYIENLENLINDAQQEETTLIITELIKELKNLEKNNGKGFYETLKKEISMPRNSEIRQRLYLSFLLIKYFKENSFEILTILLENNIHLSYLTNEAFGILKTFLKEIKADYLDEFYLISKLFYKIIVSLGIFNNLDCLKVIGDKIKELYKIPDFAEINKLNNSMEYLVFGFQEIMINNQKIKSYEGPKNLRLSIILKNNKFINCISHGLLFLSKNKIIIEKKFLDILKNYLINNENDNLLQCLIIQYKFQPNILTDNISDIYDILLFYQKINNSTESQNIIFGLIMELNIEILYSKNSISCLEKYSNEGNINPLFYILVEKIPPKFRGIYLSQKLFNYKEKKYSNKNTINKGNVEDEIAFKLYLDKDDLPLIENKLNDEKITQKLIISLKHQNNLFKFLNIEKISKYFSLSKKELFSLLIENKVIFNDNSLINLLQGFYKNNEYEIKETLNVFNKIKEYQNNFPLIIQTNLNTEESLYNKNYLKIKIFNNELLQIFNDLSFLFGFAKQHQQFILYILNLPLNSNNQLIIDKMIEFLIEKNYDIGLDIFKIIIKNIDKQKFIEIFPLIFSNKKISSEIKTLTMKNLYNIIKKDESNENKIIIFKKFKLFIDWIKLPDILLKYLLSYLKKENNEKEELNKEIIYFLGIYFSIPKIKQEKFLDDIISIFEKKELYEHIKKYVETVKLKNEIFYLFSCLNYTDFSLNTIDEEEILKIPKEYLIDEIKNNSKELNKALLEINISYMESYFNFCNFSPKRDQILRKLFSNDDKNAVNNLRLICC